MGGSEDEAGSTRAGALGWDPRVRLLGERVARSLRLKPERWERCAGSPEAEPLLRGFLDRAAPPLLLVWPGPAGQLALGSRLPPDAGRAKALFFLRTSPGPLNAPPAPGQLLCGDLPAALLEHCAALLEEVRAGRGLPAGRGPPTRRGCAASRPLPCRLWGCPPASPPARARSRLSRGGGWAGVPATYLADLPHEPPCLRQAVSVTLAAWPGPTPRAAPAKPGASAIGAGGGGCLPCPRPRPDSWPPSELPEISADPS